MLDKNNILKKKPGDNDFSCLVIYFISSLLLFVKTNKNTISSFAVSDQRTTKHLKKIQISDEYCLTEIKNINISKLNDRVLVTPGNGLTDKI